MTSRLGARPRDLIAYRTKMLIEKSNLPTLGYAVENIYPHDPAAFTQGLFYDDGFLFESTGWWGKSTVRKVRIEDGHVVASAALPSNCFGEGLVRWGNEIVSVTWCDGMGFRFDLETFREKSRFNYDGEAWGLTRTENEIVLTDGSSQLHFLDPLTMRRSRSIKVTAGGLPVRHLNDIEWVQGNVWANVWQTDLIARVSGSTGLVTGWLDLSALRSLVGASVEDDVLNGIAYAGDHGCFFVTGKKWPKTFKVRTTGDPDRAHTASSVTNSDQPDRVRYGHRASPTDWEERDCASLMLGSARNESWRPRNDAKRASERPGRFPGRALASN